jgi:tetratricopeptide (TPR) repeat protein
VVGITTANRKDGQNLNFAVPISVIRPLLGSPYRKRELWKGRSLQHEVVDAFTELEAHIKATPADSSSATVSKARVQIFEEKYEDAISALDGARPKLPARFAYLAWFLAGRAHYRLAANEARRIAAGRPISEIEAMFRKGHGRQARESLDQAQRLNSNFAPTYELLCRYQLSAGDLKEALRAANSLVKLMPQYAEGYYFRGVCFGRLEQLQPALLDLQSALKYDPANSRAHYEIAGVLFSMREYDKAVDEYNAALSLKYGAPSVCHFSIGNAYQRAGKYEQAIAAYEKSRSNGMSSDLCNERIATCRKLMDPGPVTIKPPKPPAPQPKKEPKQPKLYRGLGFKEVGAIMGKHDMYQTYSAGQYIQDFKFRVPPKSEVMVLRYGPFSPAKAPAGERLRPMYRMNLLMLTIFPDEPVLEAWYTLSPPD